MRLLQRKPLSEGLDKRVGMLDLQAVHEPERILRRNDQALPLLRVFAPAETGEDVPSVLHLRDDAVAVAVEISRLGDFLLPYDLDFRRPLLLGV